MSVVSLDLSDNDKKPTIENPSHGTDFQNHTQITSFTITDSSTPSHTLTPSPTPSSTHRLSSTTESSSIKVLEDTITQSRRHSQTSQLRLAHFKLTSFPASVFTLWPNVQILDLTHNTITSLPSEIMQLTQLKQLLLNDNKLLSIPIEIGQLTALTSLDLEGNFIESLPNEIGSLTQVRELNLRNNRLRSLPDTIGLLRQLEWLVLEMNDDLGTESIPPEVWLNMGVHILFKNDTADRILPGIFLGSDRTADNLSLLKQLKITHILTLNDKQPSYSKEFKYKMASILDNNDQILTHDYLADCIDFIELGKKKVECLCIVHKEFREVLRL